MGRMIRAAALAVILMFMASCLGEGGASILEPSPDFYVLDQANVLSQATEGEIFFSNCLLQQACGAQFVVVTVPGTKGLPIDVYAEIVFNQWGIGDALKNNGLLLVMAIDDDDYYVIPGTGLSREISTDELGNMLYDYLEDDFAAKRYDEGARKVFEALYARVAEIYEAPVTTEQGIAQYQAWAGQRDSGAASFADWAKAVMDFVVNRTPAGADAE